MIQLILKFLQAVVRETQKQLDALVGGLRVANLVRFHGGQVVLLRNRPPERCHGRNEHKTECPHKTHCDSHGCFPAGEDVFAGFAGCPGKSSLIISSSMAIRSPRTICSGGLYSSAAISSDSSTSRMALRT